MLTDSDDRHPVFSEDINSSGLQNTENSTVEGNVQIVHHSSQNALVNGASQDPNSINTLSIGQLPDAVYSSGSGEAMSSTSALSDEMKQALMTAMSGKNEAKLVFDSQWEESTRRKGTVLLDQLETELKNFKANSIKESIRRGSDDLGDLYLKLGQLYNARKCYTRSRDYCTSQQQEITMCLNVMKVAIFQRVWAQVSAHVTRAYGLSELCDPSTGGFQRSGTGAKAARTTPGTWSSTSGASITSLTGRSGSASTGGPGTDIRRTGGLNTDLSGGGAAIGSQSYRDALAYARTQLAISAGLVELAARNFRVAALNFLQVSPDYCESPTSSIVTQSDLAYFVTLCSLATFDRTELATQVLGSPHVRLLLEAEPACRDILYSFHQADYSSCLGRLNRISNLLRLDYFLADHVAVLLKEIRSRAMCQYFSPYSSADLNHMAKAFETTVAELENELASLILDGSIKARIDSHKQILRVVNVDQRCLTFARATQLVDEYKKRTQSMVLRMSLARDKLICQTTRPDTELALNYITP